LVTDRDFWTEIRRGVIQMVNALKKTRPNDRYTLDVRIVERRPVD
jgi:hypothetical protein